MRVTIVLLLGVLALSGGVGAAEAASARTLWSTYLRAGPGEDYAVLDEVEHDQPLDVLACRDKWCAVRFGHAGGYVDADALPGGALPWPAEGAPTNPCFSAPQQGYRGLDATSFCGAGR